MISLLCSVYNSSKYLDNYLTFINDQFLEEFEVIFVDANSTDDSVKKIQEYSFREGIKVLLIKCSERIPVYEAWNIAIEKSAYDYVMNYNTDDKLFKSALLSLAAYTQHRKDIDVIYSNSFISNDVNHAVFSNFYNWNDANVKENLLAGCCVGPFPLLKKKSVVDAGMFNPAFSISGDYEMWCRMQSKGYKFLKIDEPIGSYYQNPEGVSTKPDLGRHNEHLRQDNLIRQTYA